MAIQVKQEFPHCERCGIMVHQRRRRIVTEIEGRPIVFCSELCRDEYAALEGLPDPGQWVEGDAARSGERR